jgi:hypothetical protein
MVDPAFGFYAGLNMLAFVVILFFLPETKYVSLIPSSRALVLTANLRERTLEELDYIFGVPTRQHATYQLRTWLPWFIKKWVFFQRKATLEPLYKLEGFSSRSLEPTVESA